jgi:hypothetical protein
MTETAHKPKVVTLVDPILLCSSTQDFQQLRPAPDLEEVILPALLMSASLRRVFLRTTLARRRFLFGSRERRFGGATLDSFSDAWSVLPRANFQSERLQAALWWSTIVAPFSFAIEMSADSPELDLITKNWSFVDSNSQERLRSNHRQVHFEDQADFMALREPFSFLAGSDLLVAFFDEGCQAALLGMPSVISRVTLQHIEPRVAERV